MTLTLNYKPPCHTPAARPRHETVSGALWWQTGGNADAFVSRGRHAC